MISLKLAYREIKNNFKYWALFILNLSIGLIGFTFILLFRDNVNSALDYRAKTILSADLVTSGRRSLEEKEQKAVDDYLKDKYSQKTKLIEVYSMAKGLGKEESKTRLLQIKAIEQGYPLVGEIKLSDNQILDAKNIKKIQDTPLVYISKEVAHQFSLTKGDRLKIGEVIFKVGATILEDSTTSMRGVSLAPKVYIGLRFLEKTQLIKFGSVAWYTNFYLLKNLKNIDDIKKKVGSFISDPAIKIRTPKESGQQIGRVLNYLSDYLGLIGVVALLISTIGSSYLFQSYIYNRIPQIGIFKSLGLSVFQIISSFSLVIIFFGLLSTGLAIFICGQLLPYALEFVNKWIVIDLSINIAIEIIVAIISVGILANLMICIPILLRLLKSKTVDLLASNVNLKFSLNEIFYYIPSLGLLWGLSVWQAHSFKIGSLFTLSLLFVFSLVLLFLPWCLKKISVLFLGKSITWPGGISFGIASRFFVRNRLSSVLTILSLCVGVTLLMIIGQIDASLKSELTDSSTSKPSLFLFDIQQEQMPKLVEYSKEKSIPLIKPTPMIRARLLKKNGQKVKRMSETQEGFTTREEQGQRRINNRGVNLTYRLKTNAAEKIIAGKAFSGVYSGKGDVEISLERRYAKRLGVSLGDTLTFDVLGVEIRGVIVNLRSVKWTSFLPNFFVTLQPGLLDDAPKSYLAAVDKVDFERQLEIQDLIVDKFSNISILNVSEVIGKILKLFKAMAWAINLMSICCILVGMFVLYSILQGQLIEKQKEFALQRLMGMNGSKIFKVILLEYSLMIFLALFFGNFIGTFIAYGVSYFLLDGVFVFNWTFFIGLNISLFLLAVGIILVSYYLRQNKKINELLLN